MHAVFLHFNKIAAEIFRAILSELIEIDISDAAVKQSIIRHSRHLDSATRNLQFHDFTCRRTANFYHECRAGISPKMVTDKLSRLSFHRKIIYGED